MREKYTVPQLRVFRLMGQGYKLCVPHDGSQPQMISYSGERPVKIPIRPEVFLPLIDEGILHKLTEHGEPPPEERQGLTSWRLGWREKGLDGEHADFFVMTI
jgi:hypothetical protein